MKVPFSVLVLLSIAVFSSEATLLKQPIGLNLKINPGTRVIGGDNAAEGAAPYQCSLQAFRYHQCGGAILTDRYVISAAHCFTYIGVTDLSIVTGTNSWKKPGATYYGEKIFIHPYYNKPKTDHNDIALVRTNRTIRWNKLTQPIALAKNPLENGAPLILTGWGTIEVWGETPDYLQTVKLYYLSNKDCAVRLKGFDSFGSGHMCTTSKKGQGACHGDSGGPLVDADGFLIALVNWGQPCAVGEPDVHANVFYYSEWIKSIISNKL